MTNSKDSLDEYGEVDKILYKLSTDLMEAVSSGDLTLTGVQKPFKALAEAKQAIRQWVSDEIIGADEHIDPPISSIEGSKQRAFGRNKLRAKQRAKLLKGDIDDED